MSEQKELSVDKLAAIFLIVVAILFIDSCIKSERQTNATQNDTRPVSRSD